MKHHLLYTVNGSLIGNALGGQLGVRAWLFSAWGPAVLEPALLLSLLRRDGETRGCARTKEGIVCRLDRCPDLD